MKMTRAMLLGLAFLLPSVATMAKAEDKPAAEAAPADGEKKAKKKKAKKADKEEKKEEAAPPAGEKK